MKNNFPFLNLIFLPAILIIGIITSYEDFKFSKIRNKWVIIGLSYAALAYIFLGILTLSQSLRGDLFLGFDKFCINFLVSVCVAYILWHSKIWGAGDAKLFICYASLIPISQYSKGYFGYYFASFFLLVAFFVPATVFIVMRSSHFLIRQACVGFGFDKFKAFAKSRFLKITRIENLKVLLGFLFFFSVINMLRKEFISFLGRFVNSQNILIITSLYFFKPLSRIVKKKIELLSAIFLILLVYFMLLGAYSLKDLMFEAAHNFTNAIFVIIAFPLVTRIVDLYVYRTRKKSGPFAVWMFLGALIVWFF